jgi:hypothetical protein
MNRTPLPSLSWRPVELPLIPGPSRHSYGLGQSYQQNNLIVEVVDQSGKPVQDAQVEFFSGSQSQGAKNTDSHGTVSFSANGGGPFEVRATYTGLTIGQTISSGDIAKGHTAFLQFPVCIMGPLFRPIDIVIFGVAGGLIAAGSYWKVKPLEMTGEIALGAAVFGFIYRLQCM